MLCLELCEVTVLRKRLVRLACQLTIPNIAILSESLFFYFFTLGVKVLCEKGTICKIRTHKIKSRRHKLRIAKKYIYCI